VPAADGEATILIADSDLQTLENQKVVRLMGLFNLGNIRRTNSELTSEFSGDATDEKMAIIQWVPTEENVSAQVVMPDATVNLGTAERGLNAEKVGSVVQLVRFGFCRIDQIIQNQVLLYFTHQ
jgi:hypothetical protein